MTDPELLAARLAAGGIIIAIGLGTLAWMTSDTASGPTALEPPWEQAPIAVSEAEIEAARELARYLRTLPGEGNQGEIRALEWTRAWYNRPIGNLDRAVLRKLLAGNRFIYRNAVLAPVSRPRDGRIHLAHFGEDGILRTCEGGHWQRYRYHVVNDLVGAATYVTRFIGSGRESSPPRNDSDDTGWWASMLTPDGAWYGRPVTFDALAGTLAVHSENPDGTWSQYIGHVRASPFDLPGNACSEGQGTATGLPAIRGRDRAIRRGIIPLFRQDPTKPLRMGVYFSLYPPTKE